MTMIASLSTAPATAVSFEDVDPIEQWYWELVQLAYPRSWVVDDFNGTPSYKQRSLATVQTLSPGEVAARLKAIQKETSAHLPAVLQEVQREAKERIAEASKGHAEIRFLVIGLVRSVGEVALAPLAR